MSFYKRYKEIREFIYKMLNKDLRFSPICVKKTILIETKGKEEEGDLNRARLDRDRRRTRFSEKKLIHKGAN